VSGRIRRRSSVVFTLVNRTLKIVAGLSVLAHATAAAAFLLPQR